MSLIYQAAFPLITGIVLGIAGVFVHQQPWKFMALCLILNVAHQWVPR